VELISGVLANHGELNLREQGDIGSLELRSEKKIVSSFQFADRSAQ